MAVRAPLTVLLLLAAALAALGPGAARADETEPATVLVRRGPLGEVLEATGLLVPTRLEQVTCQPRDPRGTLEVVESAPEGPVVQGQVLVRFQDEDLRKQVEAARAALQLARVKLERGQRDAQLGDVDRALALDEAVRAKRLADEALERFVKVDRKLREVEAVHRLDGTRIRLENELEELQQLEKMYSADDLTEETEEIVLRRARNAYERSLQAYEWQKQRHEWYMTLTLPEELDNLHVAVRKGAARLERLEALQPLDTEAGRMDLARQRTALAEQEEDLAQLEEDLAGLVVKAPLAGLAVPGAFSQGKWSQLAETPALLGAGEKVKAGTVLYTVFDPASLIVETSVKEADLAAVRPGLPATFTTALTGEEALEAKLFSVAHHGVGGSYAVRLQPGKRDERLRAGLGCKLRIMRPDAPDVLSLPATCFTEEDGAFFVHVPGEDGPEKVAVKVGRTAEGRREVLEGLKAGQPVLEKPPAKK